MGVDIYAAKTGEPLNQGSVTVGGTINGGEQNYRGQIVGNAVEIASLSGLYQNDFGIPCVETCPTG